MRSLLALGVIVFLAAGPEVFGQSTNPNNSVPPPDQNFPNTLQPVNPVKYYGPRKQKKKKQAPVTRNAVDEYNDRIEKTWREREKQERNFENSDGANQMQPPYFGHKKPPKIRPFEKRKYCKICGIRH